MFLIKLCSLAYLFTHFGSQAANDLYDYANCCRQRKMVRKYVCAKMWQFSAQFLWSNLSIISVFVAGVKRKKIEIEEKQHRGSQKAAIV